VVAVSLVWVGVAVQNGSQAVGRELSWDAGGYPGMREVIVGCGRLSWDAGDYPGMREVILGCGRLSWDTGESYRGMLEYIRGGMSEGPSERGRSVIPE
jgi:hypothetical protein